jgi:hypothetical protein
LQNYGGPTRTLALRPGGPAENNGNGSYATLDQRGFPTYQDPDLGAYERAAPGGNNHGGTNANFFAWLWENLPHDTPDDLMDPYADADNDGASNADEWFLRTNPNAAGSVMRLATMTGSVQAGLTFTFPSQPGVNYQLQRTAGLDAFGFNLWQNVGVAVAGNGTEQSFTLSPAQLSTFGDGAIFRVTVVFQ